MKSRRISKVRPESLDPLQQLGFLEYQDFLAPPHGEIISEVRDRVVYFVTDSRGENSKGYYLKVFKNPGANRPWTRILRLQPPLSCAETEMKRLLWLEDHGFKAPRWVAWGEEKKGMVEVSSYLMTEELSGMEGLDVSLDKASKALPTREFNAYKRRWLKESAMVLARLHAQGFHHPYPYLRHFFVDRFHGDPKGGEKSGSVAVIDVHSAEIGKSVSPRNRARGLAELLVSSLKSPVNHSDRLFFLKEYGSGELDRGLAKSVLERFEQKLKRHPNRYRWARERWESMKFPRTVQTP